MNICVFAGSFDPYTFGHHEIARKAALLFDEVHIVIAVNSLKQRTFDAGAMLDAIRETARDLPNVTVARHEGLLADYCRSCGARWLVRGLRNAADYAYEEVNAGYNRIIEPSLETVYLRSESPDISSTLIRELLRYDPPAAKRLLPPAVARLL